MFKLYDTYGLPVEITQEIASEKKLSIDLDESSEDGIEHINELSSELSSVHLFFLVVFYTTSERLPNFRVFFSS